MSPFNEVPGSPQDESANLKITARRVRKHPLDISPEAVAAREQEDQRYAAVLAEQSANRATREREEEILRHNFEKALENAPSLSDQEKVRAYLGYLISKKSEVEFNFRCWVDTLESRTKVPRESSFNKTGERFDLIPDGEVPQQEVSKENAAENDLSYSSLGLIPYSRSGEKLYFNGEGYSSHGVGDSLANLKHEMDELYEKMRTSRDEYISQVRSTFQYGYDVSGGYSIEDKDDRSKLQSLGFGRHDNAFITKEAMDGELPLVITLHTKGEDEKDTWDEQRVLSWEKKGGKYILHTNVTRNTESKSGDESQDYYGNDGRKQSFNSYDSLLRGFKNTKNELEGKEYVETPTISSRYLGF
jgi:hypothetical protein